MDDHLSPLGGAEGEVGIGDVGDDELDPFGRSGEVGRGEFAVGDGAATPTKLSSTDHGELVAAPQRPAESACEVIDDPDRGVPCLPELVDEAAPYEASSTGNQPVHKLSYQPIRGR